MFILSDSPPNRDIQWSDEGISSSYKFIQKFWSLNVNIINSKTFEENNSERKKVEKYTNKMIFTITKNLEKFQYNVVIAKFYEIYNEYSLFIKNEKISSKTLKKNFEKIFILLMPILPHFSAECLTILNPNINLEKITWPSYDKNLVEDEICNIVIQINGKKRSLIQLPINSSEDIVIENSLKEEKVKKYLKSSSIKRKIYVKNKLINFII